MQLKFFFSPHGSEELYGRRRTRTLEVLVLLVVYW